MRTIKIGNSHRHRKLMAARSFPALNKTSGDRCTAISIGVQTNAPHMAMPSSTPLESQPIKKPNFGLGRASTRILLSFKLQQMIYMTGVREARQEVKVLLPFQASNNRRMKPPPTSNANHYASPARHFSSNPWHASSNRSSTVSKPFSRSERKTNTHATHRVGRACSSTVQVAREICMFPLLAIDFHFFRLGAERYVGYE